MNNVKIEEIATAGGKHSKISYVSVAQGAAGATTLAAAVTDKRHKVIAVVLIIDTAGTIKFSDGSGDLTGPMSLDQNAGFVLPASAYPYLQGGINSALSLTTTGGKVNGVVTILSEAD
jgi:hypothetical protein